MFLIKPYQNVIDFTQKYIKPQWIDKLETCGVLAASAALSFVCLSALSPSSLSYSLMNAYTSVCIASVGITLFNKYLKGPAIEQKIEKIVENSKDDQKPKALFIHSQNDHNGALTYYHANVETYQKCASKYAIDRIRGFSYEERFKVQGKKYDIISILSHGHPSSIAVDGRDFFSTLNHFSSKKINFLAARVKPWGKIILEACSTAKGENNIAQHISECIPYATVYGSSSLIYNGVGTEYDPNMTPSFNDGILCKGKDTTRIYRCGYLVRHSL